MPSQPWPPRALLLAILASTAAHALPSKLTIIGLTRSGMPILSADCLSGVDLSGARFLAKMDLRNADFRDSILVGADFTQTDLRGAKFRNADVTGAQFNGAQVDGNFSTLIGAWVSQPTPMGSLHPVLAASSSANPAPMPAPVQQPVLPDSKAAWSIPIPPAQATSQLRERTVSSTALEHQDANRSQSQPIDGGVTLPDAPAAGKTLKNATGAPLVLRPRRILGAAAGKAILIRIGGNKPPYGWVLDGNTGMPPELTLDPGASLSMEPEHSGVRKLMIQFDLFDSIAPESKPLGTLIYYHRGGKGKQGAEALVLEAEQEIDGGPLDGKRGDPGSGADFIITRAKPGCCCLQ